MHSFSNSDKKTYRYSLTYINDTILTAYLLFLGCPDPCRCTTADGIMHAVTRIECIGKHLQSVPRRLPFSAEKL